MDYERIGRRIAEERKHFKRVSQEKMAEELGMYQADISNLEHARKGSGITDLGKLELICGYLGISMQSLLFDRADVRCPEPYSGKTMSFQLPSGRTKPDPSHRKILAGLMGVEEDSIPADKLCCGPYTLYTAVENQYLYGSPENMLPDGQPFFIGKHHLYVFYGKEVIASMTAVCLAVGQFTRPAVYRLLDQMIDRNTLDISDILRTINPYVMLCMFEEDPDRQAEWGQMADSRMEELEPLEQERILLLESVYVKEDYRKHGIFRMLLDTLKLLYGSCSLWLNMEPTGGEELTREYDFYPTYTPSEAGQLSLNAAIAEKTGFTVDPDCWHRQMKQTDETGHTVLHPIEIRKTAFHLSGKLQAVTAGDDGLVALGRARQRLVQADHPVPQDSYMDWHCGEAEGCPAAELWFHDGEDSRYFTALRTREGGMQLILSEQSLLSGNPDVRPLERYDSLQEAEASLYGENFTLLADFFAACFPESPEQSNIGNKL